MKPEGPCILNLHKFDKPETNQDPVVVSVRSVLSFTRNSNDSECFSMLLFYNPKATKPRNRRFPLSILAIAAVVEGKEDYAIVDGNLDPHPTETLVGIIKEKPVELLAVTVMPGPQTVGAVATCREIRARFPNLPIVWGGYFASNYTAAALNAGYVDYAIRGQGEKTFLELVDAIRGHRDLKDIRGLSYKTPDGTPRHNPERPMSGLDDFPWYP